MVHIKGRYSNLRLQRSIHKEGISFFKVVIYYYHYDPAVLLIENETTVNSAFPFSSLFNFKKEDNSMLGYNTNKTSIRKI